VDPYVLSTAECKPANSWTYDEGPLKAISNVHNAPEDLVLYTEITVDLPQAVEGDKVTVTLEHVIVSLDTD